jgi:hypothetical protein
MFRIFYCTGWEDTVLNYRRVRSGGQRETQAFQRLVRGGAGHLGPLGGSGGVGGAPGMTEGYEPGQASPAGATLGQREMGIELLRT